MTFNQDGYPQQPYEQPGYTIPPRGDNGWESGDGTPPLWAPHYGISLPGAVSRFFRKYATFSGRASRSEYWWWSLVSLVVTLAIEVVYFVGLSQSNVSTDPGTGETSITSFSPLFLIGGGLLAVWLLATIIPNWALTVRRFHDSNHSGWFILLGLIPFVGGIITFVFTLLGPSDEGARFDRE